MRQCSDQPCNQKNPVISLGQAVSHLSIALVGSDCQLIACQQLDQLLPVCLHTRTEACGGLCMNTDPTGQLCREITNSEQTQTNSNANDNSPEKTLQPAPPKTLLYSDADRSCCACDLNSPRSAAPAVLTDNSKLYIRHKGISAKV